MCQSPPISYTYNKLSYRKETVLTSTSLHSEYVRIYTVLQKVYHPHPTSNDTARRYASAVYGVIVGLSVRLSVCLSQAGTVPRHTIVQGL